VKAEGRNVAPFLITADATEAERETRFEPHHYTIAIYGYDPSSLLFRRNGSVITAGKHDPDGPDSMSSVVNRREYKPLSGNRT
jgi:hypothetical protein